MTIYVLYLDTAYEGVEIVTLYSSLAKAERACARRNKRLNSTALDTYRVEPYTVIEGE